MFHGKGISAKVVEISAKTRSKSAKVVGISAKTRSKSAKVVGISAKVGIYQPTPKHTKKTAR
ncbi:MULTISPECIES: hypothetical protein [Niallia]|uniref:Uncharacterized protein n=1 Tax=Niallia circulans TaxID=1397 RepID=A0A0J1IJF6_NIACI|nr:hypothetical protein [Niallia circulans]KLV26062.1 hypothetical protein ABW02_13375 [Niallia circulans]MDR4318770.1 hypothetical protein [Niallia circulans]MED3840028.1 hypothetical protein [Niallia circulans]MED4245817.1 hypothetical protein [Niallia circulans]MED4250334.1 hypothetical protein [Niallia circulans]